MDENSSDIAVVAARLSLVAAQELLHGEVGAGRLTPRGYCARVRDRRDADRVLAAHLMRLGRRRDAAAVGKRIAIMEKELSEMAESGIGAGGTAV